MQSNSLRVQLYNLLKSRSRYLITIPLIIYWIVLFVATTIPTDAIPHPFGISDKVEHFFAYLVLAFLLTMFLHFSRREDGLFANPIKSGIIITLLYGAFDEIHQYFIPGRFCELGDYIANLVGILIGVLIAYNLIKT